VSILLFMGGTTTDGAGGSLAVRLARDARGLLDELRAALRRPTRADSVRALRTLFDLPEDLVERLCQDMTSQHVGALPYVRELLFRRCEELAGLDQLERPVEGGHA